MCLLFEKWVYPEKLRIFFLYPEKLRMFRVVLLQSVFVLNLECVLILFQKDSTHFDSLEMMSNRVETFTQTCPLGSPSLIYLP